MRKNIQDTCSKNKENGQNNLNDIIYFARIKVQVYFTKQNKLKRCAK